MSQVAQKPFKPSPNCLYGTCVSPIPWECRKDSPSHDWRGKPRNRCLCAACHPPSLVEALPLFLLVLAEVLEGQSIRVWPLLECHLQSLARRVAAAQPRDLGNPWFDWHALRRSWQDLYEAMVLAYKVPDVSPDGAGGASDALRRHLQAECWEALHRALVAVGLEVVPPGSHAGPEPNLEEEVHALLALVNDQRGNGTHEARLAWLVLEAVASEPLEQLPAASWEGTALEPPRPVRIEVFSGLRVGGCVRVLAQQSGAWEELNGAEARAVLDACASELRPVAGADRPPMLGGGAQVTARFAGVWFHATVRNFGDNGGPIVWIEPSGYVANGETTFAVPVLASEVIYGLVGGRKRRAPAQPSDPPEGGQNDRETDPAPPSDELPAELAGDVREGAEERRLQEADRTEEEIAATRGHQCA